MNPTLALQLIDSLLLLVAEIPALVVRFQQARADVEQLHLEGRKLTAEDWDAVHSQMNAGVDALVAASKES